MNCEGEKTSSNTSEHSICVDGSFHIQSIVSIQGWEQKELSHLNFAKFDDSCMSFGGNLMEKWYT
jgi:hypothetical protein